MNKRAFPKDFLWGASTAAHQVEGNTYNQWSEWEKANATRLAKEAPRTYGHLANWQDIKADATNPENYISGRAIDHYHRYKEDFALLKDLNMNAFRFSIEWSRIEPEEGKWDDSEIAHYREYIAELQRRNIAPVLTLWHWTMPVWFVEKGAFEKRSNVHYFERFAAKVAEEFGKDISYVITLNEPNNYTVLGYMFSKWPPLKHNLPLGMAVAQNLVRAHKQAYKQWKRICPNVPVGIAPSFTDMVPRRPRSWLNRQGVTLRAYLWNWWFIERVRNAQDFIGVNCYFTDYCTWYGASKNPSKPLNDLGWYMEPSALGRLLTTLWNRYHMPLLITETGVADANDEYRQWWLEQSIAATKRALEAGIDVRGYLHWSLLDNFEWADGWWPKFGLIAVDHKTMKRTVRPSAQWFANYIEKQQ